MRAIYLLLIILLFSCGKDNGGTKKTPDLKFDSIVISLKDANKISSKQILDKLKGEKEGYTIKSIDLAGDNSKFAKVTGEKPNLELEFLKAGYFKAKITLEHKSLDDVVAELSIRVEPHLKFDKIVIGVSDGNKISTKQILDKLKGEKEGYTIKQIFLEGDNSKFAKVMGTKPNLSLELVKAGEFKAKIILEKEKFDDIIAEFSIKVEAHKFTFNKITRTLNDKKVITTEQILAQIPDAKIKNYTLKSISLSNTSFGEVSGMKPNLQITLKKPGKLTAKIVLEKPNYVDVDINDCEISYLFDLTLGGKDFDINTSIVQTSDKGYILAGGTKSKGKGNFDVWVIKLNSSGDMVWDKTFGDTGNDAAYSIIQTLDGGYILAGYISKGASNRDIWVIKLNSKGDKVWDKKFGGAFEYESRSIIQTSDGSYILAGHTTNKNSVYSSWVIKLNSKGDKVWDKTFGNGVIDHLAKSIVKTSDGGFAVTGYINTNAGNDVFVIKLNDKGDKVWDKTFGDIGNDGVESIIQTSDGGFALAGYITSFFNSWVIKLNKSGDKIWDKKLGGNGADIVNSIIQTSDGGYALAGFKEHKGSGIDYHDFRVIKLDGSGAKVWDKTFGGNGTDSAKSIIQNSDGNYTVTGSTKSKGAGEYDVWLIKLDSQGNIVGSK